MNPLPAGSWPSPLSAASLVRGAVSIGEVVPDGTDVWWAESRPADAGRTTLVRWRDGDTVDVTPAGANVRTRVHEYGGGAWWVADGVVYYVEFDDQRLRRLEPGGEPLLLTPEPERPLGLRYADGRVTPDGAWFICVHERHGEGEPVNELVAVATDGSMEMRSLVSGADFYASPRISPDGTSLVWIQWMHPNMPWDATELWIADVEAGTVSGARMLVGNGSEALQQPEWWSDGRLAVVTDRSEWWNLYTVDLETGALTPEAEGPFEIVEPHWGFGDSRYTEGAHVIGDASGDRLSLDVELPYTSIRSLRRTGDAFTFVGASYSTSSEVVRVVDGEAEVLCPGLDLGVDPGFFPPPELLSFPTSRGETAHALFYEPANPDHDLLEGERPPLLVFVHGGPTSAAARQLVASRGHRYWTSRGFAVVDVDYRGSTRYGRTYRRKLLGEWCVIDVDDAVAAARHLADRGEVDRNRLLIEGGSAGGTLALLATALSDTFAAGSNLFGVTDLATLMTDDHKFESQYTLGLVGPWPEAAEEYARRSPINHVEELSSPMIVFQGADDTVVPRSHSDLVVDALRERGLPVAYLVFDGEGHGFRGEAALVRWFEAALSFYGQVLGFTPADDLEPVEIDNL